MEEQVQSNNEVASQVLVLEWTKKVSNSICVFEILPNYNCDLEKLNSLLLLVF